MAKSKRRYFTVTGNGAFPYDMLRYDQCWPTSEAESSLLSDNQFVGEPGHRSVTLATDYQGAPTVGRWQSFGWITSKVRSNEYAY